MAIEQILSTITATLLAKVTGAVTVEAGAGALESILQTPARLPALFAVYNGGAYAQHAMSSRDSDCRRAFHVLAVARDLRGNIDAATQAATLIEAAAAALQGITVDGGELWPEKDEILTVESGVAVYALTLSIDTRTEGI